MTLLIVSFSVGFAGDGVVVVALDDRAHGHDRVIAEGFWLEAFIKLDRLMMLNLIVCPDSTFHTDESLMCGDPPYTNLKKIYERLSTGATFFGGFFFTLGLFAVVFWAFDKN